MFIKDVYKGIFEQKRLIDNHFHLRLTTHATML